jgi:hypothetical protein
VVVQVLSAVDAEEVVGVSLAEHVDAVARDAVSGRVDGHPALSTQRELDHDCAGELVGHASDGRQRCSPGAMTAPDER